MQITDSRTGTVGNRVHLSSVKAGYNGSQHYWNVSTYWSPGSTIQANGTTGLASARSVWTSAVGPQNFSASGSPANSLLIEEYPYITPACGTCGGVLPWAVVGVTLNWTWNESSYQMCYLTGKVCRI